MIPGNSVSANEAPLSRRNIFRHRSESHLEGQVSTLRLQENANKLVVYV